MTALLDEAVARIGRLSADRQDELASILLMLAEADAEAVELSARDAAAIRLSREEAARGEFATDEEMRAIWAKYAP